MSTSLHHDYSDVLLLNLLIGIALMVLAIGIANMVRNRNKYNSYKKAFLYITFGLSVLLISVIVYKLESKCWDLNSVIDFLILRRLDHYSLTCPDGFFLRRFVVFGYALLIWGLSNIIIVKTNNMKKEREDRGSGKQNGVKSS